MSKSYGQVARAVAEVKEKYPDEFCRVRLCLWRIRSHDGLKVTPCRRHPIQQSEEVHND